MKVYISGPISGYENLNRQAFADMEDRLCKAGHEPVNPHKVCEHIKDGSWLDYMRADIGAIVECDAIVLLDGWSRSRGAMVELQLAMGLGIEIMEWVQ